MHRIGLLVVVAAACAFGCSGLGNVGIGPARVSERDRPFGGTRSACRVPVEYLKKEGWPPACFYLPVVHETVALCVLLDIPLSLAVDCVTLPYCLHQQAHPRPMVPADAERPATEQVSQEPKQ